MKKILIYGGTTEGRKLAEILQSSGLHPVVSVATEYGEEVMEDADPDICVRRGRLDMQEMRDLAAAGSFSAVIDATHPFAQEVSRNIRESLRGMEIPLLRLSRDTGLEDKGDVCSSGVTNGSIDGTLLHFCSSVSDCVEVLRNTAGNILLTTGSKELAVFSQDQAIRERLVVRVLPGEESLRLCREAGLSGRQIIAMQGPFSEEMNLAVIHQYGIRILVTKESGHAGGTDEKIAAARLAGIPCYVIRRPVENGYEHVYSLNEIVQTISEITGSLVCTNIENNIEKKTDEKPETGRRTERTAEPGNGYAKQKKPETGLEILLAGVGLGTEVTVTEEVRRAIDSADYLFGAKRVLQICGAPRIRAAYAMYQPDRIIPKLVEIAAQAQDAHIVILYSGDSGFFSGAAGMLKALKKAFPEDVILSDHSRIPVHISVKPGVSSLSYCAAAAGISWEDAAVVSLHGVPETVWKERLLHVMQSSKKIFFLTSGVSDVHKLGEFLSGRKNAPSIRMILGYQLSYPDQKVMYCTPEACMQITEEGLYAGFVLLEAGEETETSLCESEAIEEGEKKTVISKPEYQRALTPGIHDMLFIRGRVPMTKEEVRMLVICKLHLQAGSVLYDIGSGTGSVAVEAALIPGMGEVYAVEQNPEAVLLIRSNAKKFGAENVHFIEGTAPEVLLSSDGARLPVPTHAFIGGTGGNLMGILRFLYAWNPHMRVVMTAVTLETIRDMQDAMEAIREGILTSVPENGNGGNAISGTGSGMIDEDIVAVSISRAAEMGRYHLMQAANTVYIASFWFDNCSAPREISNSLDGKLA